MVRAWRADTIPTPTLGVQSSLRRLTVANLSASRLCSAALTHSLHGTEARHRRAVITMGACARAGGQLDAVPSSRRETAPGPAWKVCEHTMTGTRCSTFGLLGRRGS